LIAGVVLGGAVQDLLILCASMRRDGKSLGQIAKEEVNPVAGMAAMVAIFAIMIILLAVLGLVVVERAARQPVGSVHHLVHDSDRAAHGRVDEQSAPGQGGRSDGIGILLLIAALVAVSGCRRARRGPRRSPGRERSWRGR
jgi:carbon starvation protein